MEKYKRLYRSETDKVIVGVCAGIGDYASIDPVLVRIVWLLVVVFTGFIPGILVYAIAVYIIPKESVVRAKRTSEPVTL